MSRQNSQDLPTHVPAGFLDAACGGRSVSVLQNRMKQGSGGREFAKKVMQQIDNFLQYGESEGVSIDFGAGQSMQIKREMIEVDEAIAWLAGREIEARSSGDTEIADAWADAAQQFRKKAIDKQEWERKNLGSGKFERPK